MKRDARLCITVTDDEKARIERAAKRFGTTMCDFARWAMFRAIAEAEAADQAKREGT